MTKRPVVIIVGHMSPPGIDVNDVDSERDAFTAFVRDSYGCQSLVFDHLVFLQEKLEDVKKLVGDDDAALFVVTQSRYDDDHNKLVAVVRESISETIPISVIKGYPDYEYPIAEFNDPNVNVTSSSDGAIDALAAIIDSRRTRDSKKDYFGLTDPREVRSLSSRLASVHATESAESELAAMGENDRVLFQALRLRLLPPTELKAGFDDVVRQIEPENEPLPTVRSPVYEAEVERIRSMDDAARDAFYDVLLAATGCIRAPGGGIFKREIGRGQNNFGFAIDAVSFEEAITKGFGSHNMAAFFLENRLEYIHGFKRHSRLIADDAKMEYDIVEGTILNGISGFETPIVEIYFGRVDPETLRKVVRHIRNMKRFIPVTPDGKLLEF